MSGLVMVVHRVEAATAKVPFSMILLLDHVKRGSIPQGMRVRMVIPSDGVVSVSLWDTQDPEALKQWLDENLGGDCVSEVSEIEEEFTYGIMLEIGRARAAERVAGNTTKTIGVLSEGAKQATGRVAAGLKEFDDKTGVITSAKETSVAAGKAITDAVGRVAENPQVKNVVSNVSKGVASGWSRVSMLLGDTMAKLSDAPGSQQQQQGHTQVWMDEGHLNDHEGQHHSAPAAAPGHAVHDDPLDTLPSVGGSLPVDHSSGGIPPNTTVPPSTVPT